MKNYLWKGLIVAILLTPLLMTNAVAGNKMIVGMATDVNGLGDGSFNDGVYAGLKQAADSGKIDVRMIESKSMTDFVPNLSGLAEDGASLIFAVGFLMAEAVVEAAENNPHAMYAGIDLWFDPGKAPKNLQGITWKEHESGYLAGIVAGYMTKQYADRSDKLNNKNMVGAVLGMDIPPVERYQAGYWAGVKSVNPGCEVKSIVTGTFGDPAKGKEATLALVEQGADIVIQLAGLTGMGVIDGAKEAGILAIGADVDQNRFAPDHVLTSALKGTTVATYLTIKDALAGKFKGRINKVYGIAEGAIDIAPFHAFDSVVPAEVKNAVAKAKKDIASGKLVVPSSRTQAGF